MNTGGFENLQLNSFVINELYDKTDFIIDKLNKNEKPRFDSPLNKDIVSKPALTVEIPKAIINNNKVTTTAEKTIVIFNEKAFHFIVFESFLAEKDIIKQSLAKLLEAKQKTVQYANVVVWKDDFQSLINTIDNEEIARIVWILGIPNNTTGLENFTLYKPITLNKATILLTGCKEALTLQENKLAIWNFVKEYIK